MVRNRPRVRACATALAVGLALGLTSVASVAPQASAIQLRSENAGSSEWTQRYNQRILELVNRKRARHGLRSVKFASCANRRAAQWSATLTREDRFEHSDLYKLLEKCNANYASENLAMIYDGARPRELVRLWMNSPGHRANILSPKARFSGVSVRWDPNRAAWVAVQNFVRK
jgi:uncharacterized protein YkwD